MNTVIDKAVVVKLGGSIYGTRDSVITDLVKLQKKSQPIIIIHGGAKLVTQWLQRLNHTSSFFEGERITDEHSLDVVTAVLAGLVNKEIVAAISSAGGKAIGISGVDGALIQGKIKDRSSGYVGIPVNINPEPIEAILSAGFIPVISPISLHVAGKLATERELLNINGDIAAGAIARALNVKLLVFLTDVNGVYDNTGTLLARISTSQALALLESGTAQGGMIPKIRACLDATTNSITTCSIINGSTKHCLINEITLGNTGTTILPESISNE